MRVGPAGTQRLGRLVLATAVRRASIWFGSAATRDDRNTKGEKKQRAVDQADDWSAFPCQRQRRKNKTSRHEGLRGCGPSPHRTEQGVPTQPGTSGMERGRPIPHKRSLLLTLAVGGIVVATCIFQRVLKEK